MMKRHLTYVVITSLLPVIAILVYYFVDFAEVLVPSFSLNSNADRRVLYSASFPIKALLFKNGDESQSISLKLNSDICETDETMGAIICSVYSLHTTPASCQLYSEVGQSLLTCSDLLQARRSNGSAMDLFYTITATELFMWPTRTVGHTSLVYHINTGEAGSSTPLPVEVTTVSTSPRAFVVSNLFSASEAAMLISDALGQTDENYRLKRSSTGATGYTVDRKRTSENAFVTSSEIAFRLKRRSFDLLGVTPFDDTYADGFQVLRYNQTAAYNNHYDWIEPPGGDDHNWESKNGGSNRFATVLLYLSDVEAGGETVFPESGRVSSTVQTSGEIESYLHHYGAADLFPARSWERNLITQCRNRFSVKPEYLKALVFYSQLTDGARDDKSLHGGCPVVKGEKWAANLWIWNAARYGYWGEKFAASKKRMSSVGGGVNRDETVVAAFESLNRKDCDLYYKRRKWAQLMPGSPTVVHTYPHHIWSIRCAGMEVKTISIQDHKIKRQQRYVI